MASRRTGHQDTARAPLGPAVRQPGRKEPTPSASKCGTYAGYQRHYKSGEKPCGPCTHAQTVYVGQWRVRSGATKRAQVPYALLGLLLWAAPDAVEELAEQVLGDAVITRAMESAVDAITIPDAAGKASAS